jgi:hypothetical protein
MLYKIGTIIFFVLIFSGFKPVKAQYKYSIDIKTQKSRSVPLKYRITKAKESIKTNKELRKKKRSAIKSSKKIKKHTYRIQTREVKKRMKMSNKKAENFNKGKVPLGVKLKKIIDG